MTGIVVAGVASKAELAAAFDAIRDRGRRPMTWRDLLIQVTEELRHAPAQSLDQPVMVQVPGRLTTLESVQFGGDGRPRLVLYPWLTGEAGT